MNKKGNLSINSENIFPIIKKWLYSDHDIFLRELVSNGCDAITKRKKLSLVGEATLPDDYKPVIRVNTSSDSPCASNPRTAVPGTPTTERFAEKKRLPSIAT